MAAEIATPVGVTERTFSRRFPDKREVLSEGQAVLMETPIASIADAPAATGPLDALFQAFRPDTHLLEDNRVFSKPRQGVIAVRRRSRSASCRS